MTANVDIGDFTTENIKYKVTVRYSFGWTDWKGVFGSAGYVLTPEEKFGQAWYARYKRQLRHQKRMLEQVAYREAVGADGDSRS